MSGNDLRQRFAALVDDKRGPEECWPWQGTRTGTGYGVLSVTGRGAVGAHVLALELAGVTRPPGRHVHHRCNRAECCNPAHLEIVAPAEHGERHRGDGYRASVDESVDTELVPLTPRARQQRDAYYRQAINRLEALRERDSTQL